MPSEATDYCDLMDMPASMCAHCRGLTLADPPGDVVVAYRFTARYPSRCSNCRRDIEPGSYPGKTLDDDIVCEGCCNA